MEQKYEYVRSGKYPHILVREERDTLITRVDLHHDFDYLYFMPFGRDSVRMEFSLADRNVRQYLRQHGVKDLHPILESWNDSDIHQLQNMPITLYGHLLIEEVIQIRELERHLFHKGCDYRFRD